MSSQLLLTTLGKAWLKERYNTQR